MKTVIRYPLALAMIASSAFTTAAAEPEFHKGIYYGPDNATAYQKERCQLDIYLPSDKSTKFPVLIFFHGGGLTGGNRGGPDLTSQGVCLVAPSYRLNPKAKCPDYLNDAADAVAWTFKNIEKYGGDPNRIFVGGMSAGSYLAALIAMDKSWLGKRGVDIDRLAGLLPISGHMITHFTVRKERGISAQSGLSDEFSPLFHVRKTPFPIFIQCGDNDYPARQEENKLFVAMMLKFAKQPTSKITYNEYPGTHGTFGKNKTKQEDFARFILKHSSREFSAESPSEQKQK
jgi:acetyl esterase/lipase